MKPRETVKLFTNKGNVPRPSKGFFNFYPASNGALKVKGYNFGEKDVVLDRELEGYDYVNPYGVTNFIKWHNKNFSQRKFSNHKIKVVQCL